jgi:hypothetical protein
VKSKRAGDMIYANVKKKYTIKILIVLLLLEKSFIPRRRFNFSIFVVALRAVMVFFRNRCTYLKDGTRAVEFFPFTHQERCTDSRWSWHSNEGHSISPERCEYFPKNLIGLFNHP